jgi:hypothetical protein
VTGQGWCTTKVPAAQTSVADPRTALMPVMIGGPSGRASLAIWLIASASPDHGEIAQIRWQMAARAPLPERSHGMESQIIHSCAVEQLAS